MSLGEEHQVSQVVIGTIIGTKTHVVLSHDLRVDESDSKRVKDFMMHQARPQQAFQPQ